MNTENRFAIHKDDIGWACAQQRFLLAIRAALHKLSDHLPEWILQIDDDTYVNPVLLKAYVAGFDPGKPVYAGFQCRCGQEGLGCCCCRV